MPTFIHPQSRLAAELFDRAVVLLGVVAASSWMLSANDYLAGKSPLQAIKAGDLAGAYHALGLIGDCHA